MSEFLEELSAALKPAKAACESPEELIASFGDTIPKGIAEVNLSLWRLERCKSRVLCGKYGKSRIADGVWLEAGRFSASEAGDNTEVWSNTVEDIMKGGLIALVEHPAEVLRALLVCGEQKNASEVRVTSRYFIRLVRFADELSKGCNKPAAGSPPAVGS